MGKQGKCKSSDKVQLRIKDKKPPPDAADKRGKANKAKQPWLDDLEHQLSKSGLQVKKVAADGNCFFRACSDQLKGDERHHLQLRQDVVGFMEEHADDFKPYMEDDEDFTSYCRRMRKDGTWAGLHEQVAVARLHGIEIKVYQADQPVLTIHPEFPEIPKNAPAWHLSYHGGEHYNSVMPAEGVEFVAAAQSAPQLREQQVRGVQLGTGCEDEAAICRALEDAEGSSNQMPYHPDPG